MPERTVPVNTPGHRAALVATVAYTTGARPLGLLCGAWPSGNSWPFGQRRPFWATQALRVQKLYQKVVALLLARGRSSIGNLSMAAEGVCQT
jgi:hypothetical protein